MAARKLGLDRWKHAATLFDVKGCRAEDLVIVSPPLSERMGYWHAVEEVHRIEARDGRKAPRVTL